MNVRSSGSRLSIVGKSEPFQRDFFFQTNPLKSDNGIDKETIPYPGSVKKKTAFFENLITPRKDLPTKVNLTSCERKFDMFSVIPLYNERNICHDHEYTNNREEQQKSDFHNKENDCPESDEDGLLPPPPEYSYEYHSCGNDSLISEDRIRGIIINEKCADKSFSLLDDIYEELRKKNFVGETSSLDEIRTIAPSIETKKKCRRSLSWSSKVEYFEPRSPEEYTELDIDEREDPNSDSSDSLRSVSLESYNDCLSRIINEDPIETINMDETKAALNAKICMKHLWTLMRDPDLIIGGQEHVSACINLVESCLTQKSVAERAKDNRNVPCAIEGYLEMQEVQLRVKEGYALIDYDNLQKCNLAPVLKKLKTLYHVVLLVRCRADTQIKASHVYNVVSESDARKLGLPHESLSWLQMFEYVKFSALQPEFELIFELYLMDASPCQQTARTPLRHLLCRSGEKMRVRDRSVFLRNVGSFSVTARGLTRVSGREEVRVRVHADCVFTGQVVFSTEFSVRLLEQCSGRLNVYTDVAGVGSWAYFDCELFASSLRGRRASAGGRSELDLALRLCVEDARLCDYTVCAKPNTFSVRLDAAACPARIPCNRRVSTDGRYKQRFLAEADSSEHASHWCRSFNLVRQACVRWDRDFVPDSPPRALSRP